MTAVLPLLIVERDQGMADMLQRFFTRQQVTAQIVKSVAQVKASMVQSAFQVMLIDIYPPYEESFDLLRYLYMTAPQSRLIVMAILATSTLEQDVLQTGAYACIAKPFSLGHLWAVVQSAQQKSAWRKPPGMPETGVI